MSDKPTRKINKQLKKLGPIAAVLVAVPAVILLAPFALTYGVIKDSLKNVSKMSQPQTRAQGSHIHARHSQVPGHTRSLRG